MKLLYSIGKKINYQKNEHVFQIGQSADNIFQVVKGEIHLYRYFKNGKQIILHKANTGSYFAEASINSENYHCNAVSISNSTIYAFNTKKVISLIKNNPGFALDWIHLLSSELRQQRVLVERSNLKSTSERLLHYILTEGDSNGELTLNCKLTHLAVDLGVSKENLYRTISRMKKQHILEFSNNKMKILIT